MKLKTFADFFQFLLKHPGNNPALIDNSTGVIITYDQLLSNVISTANFLKKKKIKPGQRVLLYDLADIDWVRFFLALQLINAVAVPVDQRVNLVMVKKLIKLVKPKLVISHTKLVWTNILKVKSSSGTSKGTLKKAQLNKRYQEYFESFSTTKPVLSEILLSSGTWSDPKAITLTQQNLMANLSAIWQVHPISSDERLLSILPLSHAYEQMAGLFVPLLAGSSVVYLRQLTPQSLKQALLNRGITHIVAVPRVLELLRKGILRKVPKMIRSNFERFIILAHNSPLFFRRFLFSPVRNKIAPNLRLMVVGGAPCTQQLDLFFRGLGFETIIGYGLSETSPVISFCTNPKLRVAGSVGESLENIQLTINDQSEVLVKGPSVFWGYWPEVHTSDWFNTQDLGYINENNQLVLTGRSKNLLVFPNGDKLFLEDIELLVDSFPGIDESCVLYHPDHKYPVLDLLISAKKVNKKNLSLYLKDNLPQVVKIGNIHNVYPKSLFRTHTLKLSRNQNWKVFNSEVSK